MAITAAAAASVAALAPAVGDSVLAVAQFAVDSTRRFALPANASSSVSTCPNGGLLTITLADRDGDGVASTGDRISVEARDCAVPVVTDIVTGTMHIDLGAPTGLPAGGLRAAVDLGTGLRFGTPSQVDGSLLGSMQFDWSTNGVQTTLHVTASTADDLRVVLTGAAAGAGSLTESIRRPDLTKTLKYDEARAVIAMAYRYESEMLQGSVTVATPDPLRAYLNTYPEEGRVEVTGGAGSKVVLTPNFVSESDQFQYAFDGNGDGVVDASGNMAWAESLDGYLWWDGVTAPNGWSAGSYATRAFATTDLHADATFEWTTSSASSFRLQFSRPLAGTTPTLFFRFVDWGSTISGGWPQESVAATAQVHGALVMVRPTAPLRHARRYGLEVSTDGATWFNGATVQDALGNSTSSYGWSGMSATTPDSMRAVAVAQGLLAGPADQVLLSGQTSVGTARPVVSYQWSQVSGTPLRFGDAAAAQTTLSWGATPPTGAERVVIRLTVGDAAGDTESTDVTVTSADLVSASQVLYFQSAAGDYVGAGATALFVNGTAQFQQYASWSSLQASVHAAGYTESWYLTLSSSNAAPLQVGAYENATRFSWQGQNGLDFSGGGRGCNQTFGRFDILEIETDGFGTITRLAVDFEQHCESATAPALLGSYRVNSSVPIRR